MSDPAETTTTYNRIVVHTDGPVTVGQNRVPFGDIDAATRDVITGPEQWSGLHSDKGLVGYVARDVVDGHLHVVVAADL